MTNTTEAPSRGAAVYRFYDANGALLYVGSAYDPAQRSKKHHEKPWWALVARREDEWYPSREAAFGAETDVIKAERPLHNRISGPGPVQLPPPRRSTAHLPVGLEQLDAYIDALAAEPAAVRAWKLTELLESVTAAIVARRRGVLLEMQAAGMTYREIGAAVGVSFGRVRQILASGGDAAQSA